MHTTYAIFMGAVGKHLSAKVQTTEPDVAEGFRTSNSTSYDRLDDALDPHGLALAQRN